MEQSHPEHERPLDESRETQEVQVQIGIDQIARREFLEEDEMDARPVAILNA